MYEVSLLYKQKFDEDGKLYRKSSFKYFISKIATQNSSISRMTGRILFMYAEALS